MKVLIWFGCIVAASVIQTILLAAGVMLGGIPTIILYGFFFYLASRLCRERTPEPQPIFYGQNASNSQWGYDKQTPIATSNIREYLSCLRTSEGEEINWVHDGTTTVHHVYGLESVPVDAYKGYVESKPGTVLLRLYVTTADKKSSSAPRGLVFYHAERTCQWCGTTIPAGSTSCDRCGYTSK